MNDVNGSVAYGGMDVHYKFSNVTWRDGGAFRQGGLADGPINLVARLPSVRERTLA